MGKKKGKKNVKKTVNNQIKKDNTKTVEVSKVETNKKVGKGIHKTWATLIFEVLYIFIIEILFKVIFGSAVLDWSTLRIFTTSMLLGGTVTLVTCKLNLARKIILSIFNFFVALYAWLQLGFMDFLGAFISLGSAEQGTKITDYIGDFLLSINTYDYILYLVFILSVLYFVYEKSWDLKSPLTYLQIVTYIASALAVFFITVETGFMQSKYQTITNKDLLHYASNPAIAIKNYGTSFYFLMDVKSTITGNDNENVVTIKKRNTDDQNEDNQYARKIDDTIWKAVLEDETDQSFKTLSEYYMNREITDMNSHTGIFKGKNLIFVMLESVSFPVFDETYKEYFPTLYKLQTEGISAINNYSPKNNCATGESEMTSALSLYSIETTCTVNTYKKNVYPEAILSMFKNNGYYTSAYHDYTEQYYNRSVFEKNFGAEKFYGVTDLGMSYNPLYKEWPSDVTFVKKALPKFIDKDHFASYMVSVTSHAPYMYSSEWGDKYISLFKDLKVNTTTKRYLSKVKVVDLALEEMLTELEDAGKLDDTVIVLFGDHYPYALSSKEFQSMTPWDVSKNQEVDRTPFIIYNSATSPEVIDKITTPLDYTPTLLNLFGIDYDPRLYLGNDLFSDYKGYAVFPDNSWQTKAGFYNSAKSEYIPYEDATEVMSDDEIVEMNQLVRELRSMSAQTIKKNYFKNLYSKIDAKKKQLEELKNAAVINTNDGEDKETEEEN